MRFAFSEDQVALRAGMADLLAGTCSPAAVRAAIDGEGVVPGLWSQLAELGALGILAPEESGGLGFDEVAATLLAVEAGAVALPDPFTQVACVALPVLHRFGSEHPGAEGRVAELVAGTAQVAVGLSWDSSVDQANAASWLLLEADDGLHLLPADSVEIEPVTSVDPALRPSRVRWTPEDGTRLGDPEHARAAAADAHLRSALADAAQLCGLARSMVAMTVEYTSSRTQFGRPIGSFQAVQHHLADALLAVTFAEPLVWRASVSVATDAPDRVVDVAMAKSQASDAAERVADICLQAHGAIGYTIEADLQLFMKRSWVLARRSGTARSHRRTVAEHLQVRPKRSASYEKPTQHPRRLTSSP